MWDSLTPQVGMAEVSGQSVGAAWGMANAILERAATGKVVEDCMLAGLLTYCT
jgi:hypothetical protein